MGEGEGWSALVDARERAGGNDPKQNDARSTAKHAEHGHMCANSVVTACIAMERARRPGKSCPLCSP